METVFIDINCDVGEGVGNESDLLPLISSCNIACGGHAGDADTMQRVVQLAKQHHIKVGAHPSYPDRANFGRLSMDIDAKTLQDSIKNQLKSFVEILEAAILELHHIKPHGALYNDVAKNVNLARIFLKAIETYKTECFLYVPYGSVILREAKAQGFKIKQEAFADRNYNNDLSLVSRKQPNALIENPKNVLQHLLTIVKRGEVITASKERVIIEADTYCVHGDTPSALKILTYLSKELPKHQVQLSK